MSMLKGLSGFCRQGQCVDLAVAVIIGAAFGKIVDSLVKDIIMPVIGRYSAGSISRTITSCWAAHPRDTTDR